MDEAQRLEQRIQQKVTDKSHIFFLYFNTIMAEMKAADPSRESNPAIVSSIINAAAKLASIHGNDY